MLVLVGYVEILGLSRAVVRLYEVLYDAGQVELLCHFKSFGDVAYYHLGGIYARHRVQGIGSSHLVFGEESRVLHLPYVVVHRACAHELRLSPDFVGYLGGKVAYHYRVLERARSHLAEVAQQFLVGI